MKKKHIRIVCAGILSILLFACKEDIGSLGLNVQPEDELIHTIFFDSTTITAYSAKEDTVRTSGQPLNLLGDMRDPIFGRTQAVLCTQLRLSKPQVNFGGNPQADSLILTLAYGGHYGDTMQSLRIRVYELDEDLNANTAYYGQSTATHKSELLGEVQIQPKPNTSSDTTKNAFFSIPLSTIFAGDKFISKSNLNELNTNEAFTNYFKGLYIEAEAVSTNGCMLSINLLSSHSSMRLYYSNDENPNQSYPFNLEDSCVRFSHINHFDYAGVDATLSAQLNGDYATTTEVLYGQSSGGIKTVIQFPHLKEMFAGKQVVIHKAELVITHKVDNSSPHYVAPTTLFLSYDQSETGKDLLLFDAIFGTTYFGGTYDEKTQQYAFRITQYIQELIDPKKETANYKLNLQVAPAATRLSRSQFYGTNCADKEKRMMLKINYTIINK